MRIARSFLWVAVCPFVVGCATGGLAHVPAPEEIPALEAEYARYPDDVELGLQLASAYRAAGRTDAARAVVGPLLAEAPEDPGLLVLSGLLAEDAGEWAEARETYTSVLEADPSRALRQRVEQRLEIVRREELRASVREALAREAELADSEPDPTTVGIFPFVYEGGDPSFEPLAMALPQLLTTDLGVTGRFTVLERSQIDALILEMQLAESGRVDPATAARSGRLLGSGYVVQGRLRMATGERVAVDAAVVEVAPGGEEVDPVGEENALERLFDLEKQLAFDIYAELGVQLTQAERELINERQTESIEALLAFGRGLQASEAGNFGLAAQSFAEAEAIDPSFTAARTQRADAELRQAATTQQATAQLTSAAQAASIRRAAVQQMARPRVAAAAIRNLVSGGDVTEHQRAVLSEVLGADRIGQGTLLELIFRRPGG